MSNTIKTASDTPSLEAVLRTYKAGYINMDQTLIAIESYKPLPPAQKEEPKEGDGVHDKFLIVQKQLSEANSQIKSLKSQIATLKAAETFSRIDMIGFGEFIGGKVEEGMTYVDAWDVWELNEQESETTTDLLNDYIKQKQ